MRRLQLAKGQQNSCEAFVDAILYGKRQGFQGAPRILSFYPVAHNNPFQEILYREANKFSCVPLGFPHFEQLAPMSWGDNSIIHFHWFKKILQNAHSLADARKSLGHFKEKILCMKEQGHRILWTLHNVLPHEVSFYEEEIELRNFMANACDWIHVMNPDSIEICAPYFDLSKEKTFYTHHPLFDKIYPGGCSKEKARYELSLEDENTFLIFGSLDPYKKCHEFLEELASSEKKTQSRSQYLFVGKPSSEEYLVRLKVMAAKVCARVKFVAKSIPVDQVHLYFSACDAVVIPYDSTLNSGVVSLAATFRKAVFCRYSTAAASVFGQDYPYFLDTLDRDSLEGGLLKKRREPLEESFWNLLEQERTGDKVSFCFFEEITRRAFHER